MSNERLGYLILGIILAAAVVYFALSMQQQKETTDNLSGTGASVGETSLPSETSLDAILSQLPTTEQNRFDAEAIDWVRYTDGIDAFTVERPRGWEVKDEPHPSYPFARRIVLSEGVVAFAIYPKGEFDVGMPAREPLVSTLTLSGQPATMREWSLPDGSWLALVTLDTVPKNGFRIELSSLQASSAQKYLLLEMLNRFTFLE